MVSASSARKRLGKLAGEIPDDTIVRELLQSLEPEHNAFADHAIALIGSSVVEKALEVAILSRLVPLTKKERERIFDYEHRGPLSDLASRIKMAYAMGIFGARTRDDLQSVRAVRNAFAHAINLITFANPDVTEICASLYTPGDITIGMRVGDTTARGQYIETTLTLSKRLKTGLTKPTVNFLGAMMVEHLLP